jgi:DNA-binding transcriptional MocR family regulator
MHLVAWLAKGESDLEVSRRAAAEGVSAPALSVYCSKPRRPALLLGYAAVNHRKIAEGVKRLMAAMIH